MRCKYVRSNSLPQGVADTGPRVPLMPRCWSEQEDHHQPEDTEAGEGGGSLKPHLRPDDVRPLGSQSQA